MKKFSAGRAWLGVAYRTGAVLQNGAKGAAVRKHVDRSFIGRFGVTFEVEPPS
jgi:hypothetical protein